MQLPESRVLDEQPIQEVREGMPEEEDSAQYMQLPGQQAEQTDEDEATSVEETSQDNEYDQNLSVRRVEQEDDMSEIEEALGESNEDAVQKLK
jgi:hypothetical protein